MICVWIDKHKARFARVFLIAGPSELQVNDALTKDGRERKEVEKEQEESKEQKKEGE